MTAVTPFHAYEVAPAAAIPLIGGVEEFTAYATADSAREAAQEAGGRCLWSLYGQCPEGGVEHISDYASEETALRAYSRITGQPAPAASGERRINLPPASCIEVQS